MGWNVFILLWVSALLWVPSISIGKYRSLVVWTVGTMVLHIRMDWWKRDFWQYLLSIMANICSILGRPILPHPWTDDDIHKPFLNPSSGPHLGLHLTWLLVLHLNTILVIYVHHLWLYDLPEADGQFMGIHYIWEWQIYQRSWRKLLVFNYDLYFLALDYFSLVDWLHVF